MEVFRLKEFYGFIYITTNNINKKKYIGQKKIDENGKWKNYLGSGRAFKEALEKYGKENFTRKIVAYAYSAEELNKLEEEWVEKCNAVEDRKYYNLVNGGGTVTGLKLSDETRKKLSIRFSGKGNYFYGKRFYKEENGFYGRKHTQESKKKMSEAHKGKEPWNKGKTNIYSKEVIEKLRNAKLGKKLSKSHKANIRKAQSGENHPMFGKKHSLETRRKISEARKGQPSPRKGVKLSEETKAKLSQSKKGQGTKKVICITTNKIFDSIKEAAEFYDCNKSSITQCCKGKRKTCGKLSNGTRLEWEYYSKIS